ALTSHGHVYVRAYGRVPHSIGRASIGFGKSIINDTDEETKEKEEKFIHMNNRRHGQWQYRRQ
ncbi:hypothetical protein RDWZM_005359, partial [Blomia tropicalis]